MVESVSGNGGGRLSWLRRWPEWIGFAAVIWSALAAVLAASWAAGSTVGFPLVGVSGGQVAAGLFAAVFVAAGSTAWISRPASQRRPHRGVVLSVLWLAAALAIAGGFGFVMSMVQLVFAGTVNDGARFAVMVAAAVGATLIGAAALSFRRRTQRRCPRCGTSHADGRTVMVHPPAASAPRWLRIIAYLGAIAFLPYITMKTIWALGGTFGGVTGAEMRANAERWGASDLMLTLDRVGLDPTALAALAGIVLLLALVRPWGQVLPRRLPGIGGQRVPRWLPLGLAWLGATTLAPYGVVCLIWMGLGALDVVSINWGTDASMYSAAGRWMVSGFGFGAFGPYGIALGIAAASYQRRTRPRCVPVPVPPSVPQH